jgi:hypothetical protein
VGHMGLGTIFGAIIVICQRPGLPKAPPGMWAVNCPRCNTIQNVPETQPEYMCRRSKAAHRLWGAAPSGN